MPRYILHPGQMESKSDGQIHFIGAAALAQLYGVNLMECLVVNNNTMHTYREQPGDVHLFPRYSGDYRLPEQSPKDA